MYGAGGLLLSLFWLSPSSLSFSHSLIVSFFSLSLGFLVHCLFLSHCLVFALFHRLIHSWWSCSTNSKHIKLSLYLIHTYLQSESFLLLKCQFKHTILIKREVCLQFNLAPSTLSTFIKNEQKLWDEYEGNSNSTRLHIQSSRYEDLLIQTANFANTEIKSQVP